MFLSQMFLVRAEGSADLEEGCVLLHSMALTLHQSGHGHSHGGLASQGHAHKTPERSGEVCNGAVDAEQDAAGRGAFWEADRDVLAV